jgi:hypothetical protein
MVVSSRFLWSCFGVLAVGAGLAWLWAMSSSTDAALPSNPGLVRGRPPLADASKSGTSVELTSRISSSKTAASAPEVSAGQMGGLWGSKFRRLDRMFAAEQLEPGSDRRVDTAQLAASAARGDSSAALALHRVVAGCRGTGGLASAPECRNLPEDIRTDPLHWVLLAGQLGDPRAALPIYGLARDSIGTMQDQQRLGELKTAAIDALDKAVVAGSADALGLLWNVYSDGRLAQPDPVKAFAYLDGYAQATGDAAAADEALKLWQLLRYADRAAARTLQASLLEGVRPP